MRTITAGECDDRCQSLSEQYAPATISKATKHAEQFFSYAVRKCYLGASPATGLKVAGECNPERIRFIPRETITRVLEACPDAQWRLIVALARFGGLRVPSELMAITWDDVDWEHGPLTITSPKTKRHGKPWRTVPIFLELLPYPEAVFDQAERGSTHAITRNRKPNLRTGLLRALKQAGARA